MTRASSVMFSLASSLAVLLVVGQSQNPKVPTTDRVGFPEGYQDRYRVLRLLDKADKKQVVTVYGNDAAASVKTTAEIPYPNGAIIVMETASALEDSQGKAVLDEKGHYRRGKVLGLHVMRKGPDFGKAYGKERTGEWEYAEYRSDGSYITPPEKSVVCAQCHLKAGREKDFVYHGRFD
jgi:hypothetical protein